jgi:hypothetical protein
VCFAFVAFIFRRLYAKNATSAIMIIPTEQATPIAMPRFIPGKAESSSGACVTTSGVEEVSVDVEESG